MAEQKQLLTQLNPPIIDNTVSAFITDWTTNNDGGMDIIFYQ
jgi:hypothetical protein